MSVIDGRIRLVEAAKLIKLDWQQVKEAWRDDNCRHFDEGFISPLEKEIRQTAQAMEQMGNALARARHDCGNREDYNL